MKPAEQSTSGGSPFYIGWKPRADPAAERFVLRLALALVFAAALAAALVCLAQEGFDEARFEYGTLRVYQGEIAELPYPALRLPIPGTRDALAWPLVAQGKHGAAALVAGLAGRRVEARGTLISREGQVMLELAAQAPLTELAPDPGSDLPDAATEDLGRHVLVGEIVDTKCYYGVMKPGHSKPHRACAIRCISGGVPPTLLVRHGVSSGQQLATYFLLTGPAGAPLNDALVELDVIALPVEIEGHVTRRDGALYLAADPAAIRRLP